MIEPMAPDAHHAAFVHVFGARGQRWKRIRTLTSVALKASQLKSFLPIITEQTDDFIDFLKHEMKLAADQNNNQENCEIQLDVHRLLQKLTATVIGRAALGLERRPFNDESQHFKLFKKLFGNEPNVLLDSESVQWLTPNSTKLWVDLQTLWSKNESPIEQLNSHIGTLLKSKVKGKDSVDFLQQFKNVENVEFVHSENAPESSDDGFQDIGKIRVQPVLATGEIISQTRFLSIAGFDTTANTLTFALLLLGENPEVLERVQKEVDSFPDNLQYESLSKAEYLHCVILETLRLFPHASMLQSRLCMEDCHLPDGTVIPKGVGVLFDTWGLQRDPEYWDEPEKFIPERHGSTALCLDFFTPFGVGQRQCIGMRFALMELKAVLIRFLKQFTVTLPPGTSSKNVYVALRDTGTVWPSQLKLCFKKRF
uniref:Cytochrome P450 n=1 Tax=Panagrolaimus sp. JU765 TaxID=591449 RepID=A0AC34Q9Y9_9BILA